MLLIKQGKFICVWRKKNAKENWKSKTLISAPKNNRNDERKGYISFVPESSIVLILQHNQDILQIVETDTDDIYNFYSILF